MKSETQSIIEFEAEYSSLDICDIESFFRDWTSRHTFLHSTGELQITVLNELTWCLSDPLNVEKAFSVLTDLAIEWKDSSSLADTLIITTFEIFVEPPEVSDTLKLLFSLAEVEGARWVIFASYRNCPLRIKSHAEKYSNGLISDKDIKDWHISIGLDDNKDL